MLYDKTPQPDGSMSRVEMTRKQSLEILAAQLLNERSSFEAQWRDCANHLLPTRPKWTLTDTNRGDRRNQYIIDSTGSKALRTLRSGMMSGVTSPARPWFRLTISDQKLSESPAVQNWLYQVSNTMSQNFLRSNLYQVLPNCYGDMGGLGTAVVFAERDLDTVLRFYSIPIGSCCIGLDDRLKVKVFFRDLRYNVRQLIEKFGITDPEKPNDIDWSRFSTNVKMAYYQGNTEQWIDVRHFVTANPDYDPKRPQSKYKKYLSVYYERTAGVGIGGPASSVSDEVYLREAGYDYFPVLGPRWETSGEDIYGTNCPGFESLGDVRALQLMQKRKAQGIEKQINPPLRAATSLKNENIMGLPGRTTHVDSNGTQAGVAPIYQIQPDISGMLLDIQDHQMRIRSTFFEDLFLMLANSSNPDFTATEIRERKEEKLLALGPVLEQLNQDLLDPLIDMAFYEMVEQKRVPEPPPEIQGLDIKVEYISIMAQAQKLVGIGTVERFLGMASQIVGFNPESLDKIDTDQALDVYGELTSIPPGILRSDEQVAKIRQTRAQAQQAAQQAQDIQQASVAAKNLSQATLNGDNALNEVISNAQSGALT